MRGLRPGVARDQERDTKPDGDILVTVKLVKLGTACSEKEKTIKRETSHFVIVSHSNPHHSSLTHHLHSPPDSHISSPTFHTMLIAGEEISLTSIARMEIE